MLRDLLQDLRYALRGLRRSPGFAAMVVLSLGLGIGANAAIFRLYNAVFLRSLPVREPASLVLFSDGFGGGLRTGWPIRGRLDFYSYPLYQRLRAEAHTFRGIAGQESGETEAVLRWEGHQGGEAQTLAVGRAVTSNYFDVLGVGVAGGRIFLPEDQTTPGANSALVLSHDCWRTRFGGDPRVLGARISVNGRSFTVIGVTAPGFTGTRIGSATDFWIPITMFAEPSRLENAKHRWLLLFGRLEEGTSLAVAEANVNLTLRRFLADLGQAAGITAHIQLEPGGRGVSSLRRNFRTPVFALMAGVGLLFLIVCLNVSHLMLARALGRQREMSIRSALGAGRGRLLRQLLAEGLLLSVVATGVSAILSGWLVDSLLGLVPSSGSFSRSLDLGVDGRVVSFVSILALTSAALLGLVPAWRASDRGGRGPADPRRLAGRVVMASEVAVSLVVLVGAGLLAGTLVRLRHVERGFDEDNLLLFETSRSPLVTGLDQVRAGAIYDELQRRLGEVPGVRSASLSTFGLLTGSQWTEDLIPSGATTRIEVELNRVTPGYFTTVGIVVGRGRPFTAADRRGGEPVAVVNETMARRFFGSAEAALGRRFGYPNGVVEVVGVVGDVRTTHLRRQPQPTAYLPVAQDPGLLSSIEVRTDGEAAPARVAGKVRSAIGAVSPSLPIVSVKSMRAQREESLLEERLLATLAMGFGASALLLVCIGLYGVISEWAVQRTRELGVRIALGATTAQVRWIVIRQGGLVVLAGALVGIPVALGASRLLQGLLFGVRPMDPTTVIVAVLAMFAVAVLAAYLPARRASRIDPMAALRCE